MAWLILCVIRQKKTSVLGVYDTHKTLQKALIYPRGKIYALRAFIYKASRASKKVVLNYLLETKPPSNAATAVFLVEAGRALAA